MCEVVDYSGLRQGVAYIKYEYGLAHQALDTRIFSLIAHPAYLLERGPLCRMFVHHPDLEMYWPP